MADAQYGPSPDDFVRDQVEAYERTGGRENLDPVYGRPVIILQTIGAKSGLRRKIPLIRVERGGRYLLVGSIGGAPRHPQWVHNIEADPHILLQDGPTAEPMVARRLEGSERAEWWLFAVDTFHYYAEYEQKTAGIRDIRVYLVEPEEQPH